MCIAAASIHQPPSMTRLRKHTRRVLQSTFDGFKEYLIVPVSIVADNDAAIQKAAQEFASANGVPIVLKCVCHCLQLAVAVFMSWPYLAETLKLCEAWAFRDAAATCFHASAVTCGGLSGNTKTLRNVRPRDLPIRRGGQAGIR